jgi:hypothetical protein
MSLQEWLRQSTFEPRISTPISSGVCIRTHWSMRRIPSSSTTALSNLRLFPNECSRTARSVRLASDCWYKTCQTSWIRRSEGFGRQRRSVFMSVAENHRLWLSSARSFKRHTSATSVLLSIPHEISELQRRLFRFFGTVRAHQVGTRR